MFTVAVSRLPSTSLLDGAEAQHIAGVKNSKYISLTNTHHFVALAVKTMGPWNTEGLNLIKELGRRITEATGDPHETAYLLQRISVAVQRGNAASVVGCLPVEHSDSDV